MLFERFISIVKSNLNDYGEQYSSPKRSEKKIDSKVAADTSMNAIELKEARYLANLELKPNSSFEEIKASYKRLMKQYHPDKFHGNQLQLHAAEQVTAKLNEAYSYFEKKYKK